MLFAGAILAMAAPFLEPADSALLFNILFLFPWFSRSSSPAFGCLSAISLKPHLRLRLRGRSATSAPALSPAASSAAFVAKELGYLLEPKWLIFFGALALFSIVRLVIHTHRRFPSAIQSKSDKGAQQTSYLAPLANPYALTLLFIALTGALAGLLIDVQFYLSATTVSMGSKGNANFFANFYILLNFGSLLLQLFATPMIQTGSVSAAV